MRFLYGVFLLVISSIVNAQSIDCTFAYGKKSGCKIVECSEKQKSFLGTWKGNFTALVFEESASRPFHNTVKYSENDCLLNTENGDTFIVGHRTDDFPAWRSLTAEKKDSLLITGVSSTNEPFLKEVDEEGKISEYQLVYRNELAVLAIWSLTVPAGENSLEMRFTVIDSQDFSVTSEIKRNVVVTLSLGSSEAPLWEGVVSSGSHSLIK